MEATESPLDVLSRAATMIQDSSSPEFECARPCPSAKDLPSSRWRRERRDKASGGYAKLRASHLPASDAPLDMTTPRGLPPPYSQSTGRQSRSTPRVSVITPTPRAGTKDVAENGSRREQLSDPVIDEHFRRSLGNDYSSLFEDTARPGSRVTVTGLSVDDHFAKALGDTWTKLQKSEPELPSAVAAKAPPTSSSGTTSSETTPPAGSKLLPPRRGLVTI